ncbi:hypothetical protein VTL71DRAFT_5198 [Oculimacula yallundae]|uniref:Uncharacterized protein n=1 Tax=Oculimacula yallundae TaxID=86028 RepID=A0ABR4C0E8_9HELO
MSYGMNSRPPQGAQYTSQYENHKKMAFVARIPEEEFSRRSAEIHRSITCDPTFSGHGPQELIYEIDTWRYKKILEECYGPFKIPHPHGGFPDSYHQGTYTRRGQSTGQNTSGHQAGGQKYNNGYSSDGGPGYNQPSQNFSGSQFQNQQQPRGYQQPPQSVGNLPQHALMDRAQGSNSQPAVHTILQKSPMASSSGALGAGVPEHMHSKNATHPTSSGVKSAGQIKQSASNSQDKQVSKSNDVGSLTQTSKVSVKSATGNHEQDFKPGNQKHPRRWVVHKDDQFVLPKVNGIPQFAVDTHGRGLTDPEHSLQLILGNGRGDALYNTQEQVLGGRVRLFAWQSPGKGKASHLWVGVEPWSAEDATDWKILGEIVTGCKKPFLKWFPNHYQKQTSPPSDLLAIMRKEVDCLEEAAHHALSRLEKMKRELVWMEYLEEQEAEKAEEVAARNDFATDHET